MTPFSLREKRSGNYGCCIPNSSQNGLSVGKFLGPSPALPPGNADSACKICGLANAAAIIALLNFDIARRLKPSEMLQSGLPAVPGCVGASRDLLLSVSG